VRSYVKIKNIADLSDVASSLINNVIRGSDLPRDSQYQIKLKEVFEQLDHVLRTDAEPFRAALANAPSKSRV
jgi:hypothetical protein